MSLVVVEKNQNPILAMSLEIDPLIVPDLSPSFRLIEVHTEIQKHHPSKANPLSPF